MIRTDRSDLILLLIGLVLCGVYIICFSSHSSISNIAIFFGLKSDLFFVFAISFFIYSLIKKVRNNKNNRLEKIFFTIFSLKNGFLCVSGFLFSASIFSFNNHLQEAAMFLSVSIYIYFLACGIRLIEEKICYEIYEFIQPFCKK
ncbi:hypothetical protein GCM10025882_16440 [Acinetobacter gyllenbergii]|uniref:Uncharacterized protein n=1 Tax=Acinetobacter gyllenbergii CIP 110306 = MTCC 11365 TaxID=1217657 RepID=A0A829HF99_9GAMM|nr:hypothetical protein [Acinetobacter gyllenbergii]EPF77484.1 hypothetical protein F957_02656 [Acinetobacter gyllenbergii CIP 110306 = MTCC 11365]ESK41526.1 hypothetical protein F987_02265 [Acinetobacter gyllenbergii NIPH 230]GMA11219.1 hypothetical protein GCM10025882_16440 [Acinetobacter gyllenbergii]